MRSRKQLLISTEHPAAVISCGWMALSAVLRLQYYIFGSFSAGTLVLHLLLPLSANVCFILGILLGKTAWKPLSVTAVVLGVGFFIVKAFTFAPLHQALCTVLYLTVLVLYIGTVLGLLPTKKLLYPLFGLPLLYHLLVEDTKLYFFAEPPVPLWEWLLELSVLSIMAALLTQTFAMYYPVIPVEKNRGDDTEISDKI